MEIPSKLCSKCKEQLPLTDFSPHSGNPNGYLRPECRKCASALQKLRKQLKEKHGTAPSDHQCPICLKEESELQGTQGGAGKSPWVLDHCHVTNTFRGFLCHNCNRGIGTFYDSIEMFERAIDYVETHREKEKLLTSQD